jgi:glycosyltransferase involved in cell wall biosynthesis
VPAQAYPVVQLPGFRPLTAYLSMLSLALRVGRRTRPDVVYFRSGLNPLPVWLGRRLNARVVIEVNADPVAFFQNEGATTWARLFLAAERWNVRRSDLVIALTAGLKRTLIERHGISESKIRVIPSGTDPEHFMPAEPEKAKGRLELPPADPVVGFVGLFYRHQGVETLIEAAPQILAVVPRTRFLIVGDGVMRPRWEACAENLGVTHAVRFSGQVPYRDVPRFLQAMDVVVAPFTKDRGETSPFKILDALSCGRPVVASNLPSVTRLARGFDDAITLVPPDDRPALAAGVLALLRGGARREQLGMRGRAGILRQYSWEAVSRQVEAAVAGVSLADPAAHRVPTRRSTLGSVVRAITSRVPILARPPQANRPEGISVIMRVKDEETWIAPSIRSIACVADEIVVGDNGSTDGTPEVLRALGRELPDRLKVFRRTDLDIKGLTNLLIERTQFRWIIRWDADFVARTHGPADIRQLRQWLLSQDRRRYWFVYLRMVEVCGDLSHQRPESASRADCHCFTASPHLRYRYDRTGYEAPQVPPWYRVLHYEQPTFFHVDVKPTVRMFLSWLWKRFLVDSHGCPGFDDYAHTELKQRWEGRSLEEAAQEWAATAFHDLIPYDRERCGDYPTLLEPALEQPRYRLRYLDGQIVGRSGA